MADNSARAITKYAHNSPTKPNNFTVALCTLMPCTCTPQAHPSICLALYYRNCCGGVWAVGEVIGTDSDILLVGSLLHCAFIW